MIEKVARAIYEKRNGAGCRPWSILTKSYKAPYLDDARAALEAMREPDDDMAKAGIAAWEKSPMAVVTQFRAMIDKAIQESGE